MEHCLTTLFTPGIEGPLNPTELGELCVSNLAVAIFKSRSPEGCGFNELGDELVNAPPSACRRPLVCHPKNPTERHGPRHEYPREHKSCLTPFLYLLAGKANLLWTAAMGGRASPLLRQGRGPRDARSVRRAGRLGDCRVGGSAGPRHGGHGRRRAAGAERGVVRPHRGS